MTILVLWDEEEEEEDDEPYCLCCGEEDDLAFMGNYANGEEWKCRSCGYEFMF